MTGWEISLNKDCWEESKEILAGMPSLEAVDQLIIEMDSIGEKMSQEKWYNELLKAIRPLSIKERVYWRDISDIPSPSNVTYALAFVSDYQPDGSAYYNWVHVSESLLELGKQFYETERKYNRFIRDRRELPQKAATACGLLSNEVGDN